MEYCLGSTSDILEGLFPHLLSTTVKCEVCILAVIQGRVALTFGLLFSSEQKNK